MFPTLEDFTRKAQEKIPLSWKKLYVYGVYRIDYKIFENIKLFQKCLYQCKTFKLDDIIFIRGNNIQFD